MKTLFAMLRSLDLVLWDKGTRCRWQRDASGAGETAGSRGSFPFLSEAPCHFPPKKSEPSLPVEGQVFRVQGDPRRLMAKALAPYTQSISPLEHIQRHLWTC